MKLNKNDGWIEWGGGECPVKSDSIVDVRFRSGEEEKAIPACNWHWKHDGSHSDLIAYRLHRDINSRANDDRLEQDLNECIGQNVDMPEWSGEGLPPVGTICEALIPALDNTLWHWRTVKIVESGAPGAEKEVLAYDIENTKPAWTDEFRPLRTEAEKLRELAIDAMTKRENMGEHWMARVQEEATYEAIAAGKITGVKLEAK